MTVINKIPKILDWEMIICVTCEVFTMSWNDLDFAAIIGFSNP